ncbi:MAG: hypothetical protein P4L84_35385, partial [Isosphaeraceae bacterium]|nr:hypothetical protein [Isosphaeraceae bacterium]
GGSTRAAAFARALYGAAVPSASRSAVTGHGQTFAERTVVPTLATAGLGLLVGDLTTAAAVLRPDYATGPGLGVALELLEDTAECARRGILVRDPSALRRLAEADVVLFDDHPALLHAPLEVATVCSDSPAAADVTLRCAAAALRHLADERSAALAAACEGRGLAPLDVRPVYRDPVLVVELEGRPITVADAGSSLEGTPALTVKAGKREIGWIGFRPEPRPYANTAVQELQDEHALTVGLLSGRTEAEAFALAGLLGIEHVRAGLPPGAKAELLRSFSARGLKVALVSDGRLEPEVAREAYVALSTTADIEPAGDPSSIVILGGDVSRLGWLRAFARSHVARVQSVHGSTIIPNLVCVAGAFFFGFTSMSSVLITNLGTLGVYTRLTQRVRPRPTHERTPRRGSATGSFRYNGRSSWQEGNTPCPAGPTHEVAIPSARG